MINSIGLLPIYEEMKSIETFIVNQISKKRFF